MTDKNTPAVTGQAAALPKTYAQHPLSAAFPAMGTEDFQALTDSIDHIGVQNPITLMDGMVIDGWHRYSAALQLGMDCPSKELEAWIDPIAFVRAQNKDRRHLTLSAWALIEVSLRDWKPAHRPDKEELSSSLQASNQDMADAVGVTTRTIRQAKSVQTNAAQEVQDAVLRGEIGLPKAAAIARLPQEQQAAAISKPLPRPPTVVVPPPNKAPAVVLATMDDGHEEDGAPSDEEIAAAFAAEEDDRKLMHKMLESDDVVATLHAQVKQLQAEVRITNERFNGLMNTNAALTDLIKKRDWQIKKQQKEIDELRKQGGAR